MRESFRVELDELIGDLAEMTRLGAKMIMNASTALHQTDLALTDLVIADDDEMTARCDATVRRCVTLLALQAPVAADLRIVVAAMRAADDLKRMGNLARHIAKVVRLKHPTPIIPGTLRPVFARMGLLANQLAEDAATAIDHRDALSGDRLAEADGEVDVLRCRLFFILLAEDWAHGVEAAVDVALIGRYYERFADHAVAIARQVCYLATGRMLVGH